MKLSPTLAMLAAVASLAAVGWSALADTDGPAASPVAAKFDDQQRLVFPADYRRWVYLSTGLDMSYSPMAMAGHHMFDNVFVDPAAYEAFLKTGHWPDGAVLMIEVRGGETKGSITRSGFFQGGEPMGWEAHVKDSRRFAGGWGFFGFEKPTTASLIPASASCYACHQAHAAVDTTFAQFYPTLLPVAARLGTISPAYTTELGSLKAAQ